MGGGNGTERLRFNWYLSQLNQIERFTTINLPGAYNLTVVCHKSDAIEKKYIELNVE